MKWIKYRVVIATVNVGTEENPEMKDILQDMGLQYSEANEEIVKEIAYNGEYTIEDDGQPESIETPTKEEELEARLTYVEMMTGLLEV